MSDPKRKRWLKLSVMGLSALVAIPLVLRVNRHFEQQAAAARQQEAAVARQEAIIKNLQQRGGSVVQGFPDANGLPPVVSIDLSAAQVDSEVMRTVSQFPTVERLNLSRAELQPDDWALLGKFPRLQALTLSHSNISDADLAGVTAPLTTLVLNGTAITDKCLAHVATLTTLTTLELADTTITPEGLQQLVSLPSLQTLWIDQICVTADGVGVLQKMSLRELHAAGIDGLGRDKFDLLAVCKGVHIRGHHRDGYVIWENNSNWSNMVAGVAEAVISEVGLDAQQAAQLLGVLAKQGPVGWARVEPPPPVPPRTFGYSTTQPDRDVELKTMDEFLRELGKQSPDFNEGAVRRFVREKFTSQDVPKLLAALRAAPGDSNICRFGPFLLVHHGINDPEVRGELDRLLAQKISIAQLYTITAFGFGGANDFYSREEWQANPVADDFAVPRLLQFCRTAGPTRQGFESAVFVLAEIAARRPQYAADVLPVLVDSIEKGARETTVDHIAKLAELDPQAGLAVVPQLRKMLKPLDDQLPADSAAEDAETSTHVARNPRMNRHATVLEALATVSHHHPKLAEEIAAEYLERMKSGLPFGHLAPLLSPDIPATNRKVVLELLQNTDVGKGELASVSKAIRDWRTSD